MAKLEFPVSWRCNSLQSSQSCFCLSYVSSDKISKMKLKTQIINHRLSIQIHKYHSWAVQAMTSLTSLTSCRHCVLMSQCCCILLLLQVSASRLNDLETLQHAGRQCLLHHELWHPALNRTNGKAVRHVSYMCSHRDDICFKALCAARIDGEWSKMSAYNSWWSDKYWMSPYGTYSELRIHDALEQCLV